ncbi:hypothetical protein [Candidatus Methylobacter oryzae]|nr:hypothetical protein [Candidatus Methylobacter oryzae]
MDVTHPHHNKIADYGWVKTSQAPTKFAATPDRQQLNINGALVAVT